MVRVTYVQFIICYLLSVEVFKKKKRGFGGLGILG